MTPRESDEEAPRSGTRRARGGGPNPKVILGILGVVAVIAAVGVGMKSLPDLSHVSNTITSPPPPTMTSQSAPAMQPGNAASVAGNRAPQVQPARPEAQPARPASEAVPSPVAELAAKRQEEIEINSPPAIPAEKTADAKNRNMPFRPEQFDRDQAEDEVDTDRGRQLMGRVKTVVLMREGVANDVDSDPHGAIWKRVVDRHRSTLEKSGLTFDEGTPGPRSAVLKVVLKGRPSPVGTPGTQEYTLSAELICFDPEATEGDTPYASVWKHRDSLGTLARKSIRAGKIPESLDRNIADFASRLRIGLQQAAKAASATPDGDAPEKTEDDADSEARM